MVTVELPKLEETLLFSGHDHDYDVQIVRFQQEGKKVIHLTLFSLCDRSGAPACPLRRTPK